MIMQADVILVAAGKGERMGAVLPKPFLSLSGTPLLVHTLRAVTRSALVRKVILVIAAEHKSLCQKILQSYGPLSVPITLVYGGVERQDSVRCGLVALDPDSEIVAIHDAARPFLDPDILDASIHAAVEHGGAVVAVPARDTIKRVTEGGVVVETVPRQQLWLAQTPQTFRVSVIREAHARAEAEGIIATDDAALLEWNGKAVTVVVGSPRNFKLTTPDDFRLAEAVLAVKSPQKK
jgi:2-C-methyl-D-erythritol 4-phosphate cytidylyltransferase